FQVKTMVSSVSLPGVEGRLGILRGHAPMLAPLAYGLLRYRRQGEWVPMVLRGGFATVQNNVVTILTTACERKNEIPVIEDARQALEEATNAFTEASTRTERLAAADALKLASARLQ
ncbi:atpE, partial [Symbiodinium necroappetens]